MASLRISDSKYIEIVDSPKSIEIYIRDRLAPIALLAFNDRMAIARSIASLLDARISQVAQKEEHYTLDVDSLGKWLIAGTGLWHPVFLCREYIAAIAEVIASSSENECAVVRNHYHSYGEEASNWGLDFEELDFEFAVMPNEIVVSGISIPEFLELFDRSGPF